MPSVITYPSVFDGVYSPIVFSRASKATYYNSAGVLTTADTNVPRKDYNPSTLQPLGLLIEEARTNLILYSEQFDTWSKVSLSVTNNAVVAPDGTTTADKIIESAGSSQHLIFQGVATTLAATYTYTIYAKAAEWTSFRLQMGAGGPIGLFNLSAGTAATENGATAVTIVPVGNGWYRCSVVGAANSSSAHYIYKNATIYTGDGTSGLYVWGAQLEAGAFATSYISTTTAAATRSADVANVNTLSPWYNATEGTLFVRGQLVGGAASTFPYVTAFVGTVANTDSIGIPWTANSGNLRFGVRSGGVGQADIPVGAFKSAGASFKIAGCYAANDFRAASDGVLGTADTSGSVPTVVALSLGGAVGFQPIANTYISSISYYPRRLSNAELQAITV